ncbi:hypothetical protein VTL71DRAFT_15058 [Oculimacula yallundae]|uniref:Uncharacterized protein n=1 Tax=Oculimacula yallundae TaxID=86028 RepID=A0ABR4CFJ4_9HELO
MNYNSSDPQTHFHDAPESIVYDQSPSYNSPEAVPYQEHYTPEKTLNDTNPKVMDVGMGTRRRLGDMTARRFWLIFGFVCALVIAASVGGAVGGSMAVKKDADWYVTSEDHLNLTYSFILSAVSSSTPTAAGAFTSPTTSSSTSQSSSFTPSTSTSSSSPAAPTIFPAPSKTCQNGTTYASLFLSGENGGVKPGTGLTFTRLCNRGAVLNNIGSTYAYNLEDCIEICVGINFWPGTRRCTSVVYRPEGKDRPVNCWAADRTGAFSEEEGLFMGLLS